MPTTIAGRYNRAMGLGTVVQIGWRAAAALAADASDVHVLAPVGASIYIVAAGEILWLAGPTGVMHSRAIVLSEAQVDRLFADTAAFPGFKLVIDLEKQLVSTPDGSLAYSFEVEPYRKHRLLNGLDDIGLTLQHADEIREFEAKRLAEQPWLA